MACIYSDSSKEINRLKNIQWLEKNLKNNDYNFAIVNLVNDELIANCGIMNINQKDRCAELGIFMVDMHIHTLYSDGDKTVEEVLKMCQEKNLEYISIIDHNTCKQYEK